MKIEVIQNSLSNLSTVERVLTNRGVELSNVEHYLNTTDDDINDFKLLGEDKLKAAATAIVSTIKRNEPAMLVVDCDCDGYTSAAIFANYFYDICPAWVENNLDFFLHDDKSHGLSDCCSLILQKQVKLVILPDAGSNDAEYAKTLTDAGIKVVCLDHHEMDIENPYAIIVNNQDKNEKYPNKHFSGAGVVWQFCRYLDSLLGVENADNYLDLCALGNCADVMDTGELETKHVINKGFRRDNLKNPFIDGMAEKNKFKLGEGDLDFMSVAFYIAPMINAVVRSGTLEEKTLLFNSMLKYRAFNETLSTKRGHALNEKENIITKALRMVTNVKNRQTREQSEGESFIENKIKEENLLDHKVLLVLLEKGDVRGEIRGLIANRLMSKYQRPCAILTRTEGEIPLPWNTVDEQKITYQGSMRGYTNTGIEDFKKICEESNLIDYCIGHGNAAGLGIDENNIEKFVEWTDNRLAEYDTEVKHRVDFLWDSDECNSEDILTIAQLKSVWSSTFQEPLVAVTNVNVDKNNLFIYKESTIKIALPNVDLMIFNSNMDTHDKLLNHTINIVGKCHCNSWNGIDKAQIFVDAFEIIKKEDNIVSAWNF